MGKGSAAPPPPRSGLTTPRGGRGLEKKQSSQARLQTECGTPLYIAPEVLSEPSSSGAAHDADEPAGSGYDEKCDVWSCGIII